MLESFIAFTNSYSFDCTSSKRLHLRIVYRVASQKLWIGDQSLRMVNSLGLQFALRIGQGSARCGQESPFKSAVHSARYTSVGCKNERERELG